MRMRPVQSGVSNFQSAALKVQRQQCQTISRPLMYEHENLNNNMHMNIVTINGKVIGSFKGISSWYFWLADFEIQACKTFLIYFQSYVILWGRSIIAVFIINSIIPSSFRRYTAGILEMQVTGVPSALNSNGFHYKYPFEPSTFIITIMTDSLL